MSVGVQAAVVEVLSRVGQRHRADVRKWPLADLVCLVNGKSEHPQQHVFGHSVGTVMCTGRNLGALCAAMPRFATADTRFADRRGVATLTLR